MYCTYSIAFINMQKDSLGRLTTDMKRLKLLPQSWRPVHVASMPPPGQSYFNYYLNLCKFPPPPKNFHCHLSSVACYLLFFNYY